MIPVNPSTRADTCDGSFGVRRTELLRMGFAFSAAHLFSLWNFGATAGCLVAPNQIELAQPINGTLVIGGL